MKDNVLKKRKKKKKEEKHFTMISKPTALDAEIDKPVYKLYELTEEEILIIENSVK